MRKLLVLLACVALAVPVHAFNLWEDIKTQSKFPIGQVAQAGTALSLTGGPSAYSAFAEIYEYRMLEGAYGGIKVNQTDTNLTDALQGGIRLKYFADQFTQSLPPYLAWLGNVDTGPAVSVPLITGPRQVRWWWNISYVFGASGNAPTPVSTPTPSPAQ